ncbi:hypothetical protein DBR32_15260 [Taibaiella sp. KBW10]|uniref:T9SS type A sorting domain-containing protein n=1 Tax=Taibaiella sp. KBW10 TaxID=2153357 RepID=UPI000F59B667|nr:T9SS type A sorting domain-containing protein [Taibaiella sp. KBW10]RQO29692.1 hypothetical protein DBR32_15260 [Taibaiella sp. KBW10]
MRLKYSLAIAALALSTASQAQTWIHDTITTEANYAKNVYYSLANGSAGTAASDNWHIGFSTNRFSPSIISNSADKGVRLYVIATDTTKFGTNLTAALNDSVVAHPMSLYNSNKTWENGAFNQTSAAAYGWATYNSSTHWLEGRVVFGLITGTDTFQVFVSQKQTTPAATAPVYVFKVAKIDGTNAITKTYNVTTGSNGKNFGYYNLTTATFLDREPLANAWDFMFSNYNDENVVLANAQYKVFGVINNEKLKVARVDTVASQFNNLTYSTYAFDTVNNSIGRAWKASGPGGIAMNDSVTYFVKVTNGDVWQLVFTAHNSGGATTNPGLVALKKRKVYTQPVSIKTVENAYVSTIVLAPNPAQGGNTNLLIDAKQNLNNTQIFITDINGRTVYQATKNLRSGFQQIPLSLNNLSAGLYMINISGEGFRNTQKLVIQ